MLAAGCYFSAFVAPFLFPIVSQHETVKGHAKKACISHVVPFLCRFLMFLLFLITSSFEQAGIVIVMTIFLLGFVNIIIVIWNMIKGVQVLSYA